VTSAECPREQDLVDVLTTGRWPDRCDEDLRRHVASCDGCRDLVAILEPIGDAWTATRAAAHLPASGMVWWRAQMRARQEAALAAERPVTVAQLVGGLIGAAAVCAGLIVLFPWLTSSLTVLVGSARGFVTIDVFPLGPFGEGWVVPAALAATFLALTTLAVYVAVAED
jgi:hypothetical protein